MTSQIPTNCFLLAFLLVASIFACPNDPLCQMCSSSGMCLYCVYSYPGSNGVCQAPTTIIPGCYSYISATVCSQCQDFYYTNLTPVLASQACTPLDPSITAFCRASLTSTTTCSACRFNILAYGNTCQPGNMCADPNCESCYFDPVSGNQSCWVCQVNFVMWTGVTPPVCIPAAPQQFGCYASSSLISCSNCNFGYYWQNGLCIANSGTNFGTAHKFAVSGLLLVLLFFKI